MNEFLYYENTDNSQELLWLIDLKLIASPNVWKCANFYAMEKFCGKPYHSQAVSFWGSWKLLGNPSIPQSMNQVKYNWEKHRKATLFSYYGLGLEIHWVRQPSQFPDIGN